VQRHLAITVAFHYVKNGSLSGVRKTVEITRQQGGYQANADAHSSSGSASPDASVFTGHDKYGGNSFLGCSTRAYSLTTAALGLSPYKCRISVLLMSAHKKASVDSAPWLRFTPDARRPS